MNDDKDVVTIRLDFNSGSTYPGGPWYPIRPNPLPWWKRFLGKELYLNPETMERREGNSTSEGSWL